MGLLYFAKNISKHLDKNSSGKYSQKRLDHTEESATEALKIVSKYTIRKSAEGTDDLIGNRITDKTTNFLKTLPQNSSVKNR